MANQFPHLLSPFTIGKVRIKNRLCVGPMGDGYLGLNGPHGEYSDLGIEHIIQRAKGGFGLYICGCMFADNQVDPADPSYALLNNKEPFRKQAMRLNERADYYGMKVFQQISMGLGRNYLGLYSCSANEVFEHPEVLSPVLTKEQIRQKIDCVIEGASVIKDSGFAGVEVHALHWGYLLDQFAMSITNHREDEYGGSLENRLRCCKEIVEGIKQVCGDDFPVSIRLGLKSYISRLNKSDLTGEHEAGRTLEEAIRIAQLLESYGYDVLNVDTGMYDSFYYACPPSYMPHGHVIPLAADVKKNVHIPVICGSRMNDPYMDEEAVSDGKIDGVVLVRGALADPNFAKKLEMGTPDKIRPCIGCLVGCMNKLRNGELISCAVNPVGRKEGNYSFEKTMCPKKIAVVGGGVAGMEVARVTKLRGHDVTIYEKSDCLGGLLHAAGAHSFKKEIHQLMEWYIQEMKDLEIPVVFGAEMNAEKIKELHPDIVVLAMGSTALMPKSIQGIDHPKSVSGIDVLTKQLDVGQDVIVIGGGLVGCEMALEFAMEGKNVTVVEAAPAILGNSNMLPLMSKQMVPDMLEYYHVKCMPGHKIDAVNDEGAVISPTEGGDPITLPADKVVFAIGRRMAPSFADELYGEGIECYSVGDMNMIGNCYTSISSAYEIARSL